MVGVLAGLAGLVLGRVAARSWYKVHLLCDVCYYSKRDRCLRQKKVSIWIRGRVNERSVLDVARKKIEVHSASEEIQVAVHNAKILEVS